MLNPVTSRTRDRIRMLQSAIQTIEERSDLDTRAKQRGIRPLQLALKRLTNQPH